MPVKIEFSTANAAFADGYAERQIQELAARINKHAGFRKVRAEDFAEGLRFLPHAKVRQRIGQLKAILATLKKKPE